MGSQTTINGHSIFDAGSMAGRGFLREIHELDRTRWYAACTCSRHEKSVARHLESRAIDAFLPLYQRVSRWKDRRVIVQEPLFAGYIFVRISLAEKMRVLELPSVSRLIGFNGEPTPLPDEEIEALRDGLNGGVQATPCPYLAIGRRVRVRSGPLQGLEGILQKKKKAFRFIISMELIQRSISVEVDAADLQALW